MKTCAITGHRPNRFKWKYQEENAGCKRLKKRLREQVVFLYGQGVRRFYAGGALGVDMWVSETLIDLQNYDDYSDIELILVIPFEGYDANWDMRSKRRMSAIKSRAADVIIIGIDESTSISQTYRKRNQYMVNRADCLLAVYDVDYSSRSGTSMTVHYAEKKSVPIILIHPDTAAVSILKTSPMQ